VKGLGYPSTPESTAQAAAAVPDARERLYVVRYGADHWDAGPYIEADISQSAWARQHNVPLVCNEFGVYPHFLEFSRSRGVDPRCA
jgi:endoglucanase